MRHVLQGFADNGHCAVAETELVETATGLLEIPSATIERAVELELQAGHLVAEAINGTPCLFLTPLYRAEVGVASQVRRLLEGTLPWGQIDPARVIPWVEQRTRRRSRARSPPGGAIFTSFLPTRPTRSSRNSCGWSPSASRNALGFTRSGIFRC